eukprot:2587559-Pyramimonas_sp.AAC.1
MLRLAEKAQPPISQGGGGQVPIRLSQDLLVRRSACLKTGQSHDGSMSLGVLSMKLGHLSLAKIMPNPGRARVAARAGSESRETSLG